LPGCMASLETGQGPRADVVMHVQVAYESLEDLGSTSASLFGLAGEEPDMLTALIAAPWSTAPASFAIIETPWFDHYVYEQSLALGLVPAVSNRQLQYTEWRLVEIASGMPGDEVGRLEQQLTGIALRDERQVWENLSASTYWTYAVRFGDSTDLERTWLIGWDQDDTMTVSHRDYHWEAIAQTVLALLGACTIVVIVWRLARHRRVQRRG